MVARIDVLFCGASMETNNPTRAQEEEFLAREVTDAEFENYVRACNSDIPIAEVKFFLPDFSED